MDEKILVLEGIDINNLLKIKENIINKTEQRNKEAEEKKQISKKRTIIIIKEEE